MGEYIQMMAAENPKAVQDILRGIQQKCSGQRVPEDEIDFLLKDADEKDIQQRLKCIADAIGDAVKENDFNSIWEQAKRDLKNVGERMKKCRTEQSKEDMAK